MPECTLTDRQSLLLYVNDIIQFRSNAITRGSMGWRSYVQVQHGISFFKVDYCFCFSVSKYIKQNNLQLRQAPYYNTYIHSIVFTFDNKSCTITQMVALTQNLSVFSRIIVGWKIFFKVNFKHSFINCGAVARFARDYIY